MQVAVGLAFFDQSALRLLEGGGTAIDGLADAVRRILDEESYRAAATPARRGDGRAPLALEAVPLVENLADQAR